MPCPRSCPSPSPRTVLGTLVALVLASLGLVPPPARADADPSPAPAVISVLEPGPDFTDQAPTIRITPATPEGLDARDVVSWRVSYAQDAGGTGVGLDYTPDFREFSSAVSAVADDDALTPFTVSGPASAWVCLQAGTVVDGSLTFTDCGPWYTYERFGWGGRHAPGNDGGVMLSYDAPTTLTMTWRAPRFGGLVESYDVRITGGVAGPSGEEPVSDYALGPEVRSFVIPDVLPGVDYTWVVGARNQWGEGAEGVGGFRGVGMRAPGRPTSLAMTHLTRQRVRLEWRLPASTALAARTRVAIRLGKRVGLLPAGSTSLVVLRNLVTGPTVRFAVQARGPGGRSGWVRSGTP